MGLRRDEDHAKVIEARRDLRRLLARHGIDSREVLAVDWDRKGYSVRKVLKEETESTQRVERTTRREWPESFTDADFNELTRLFREQLNPWPTCPAQAPVTENPKPESLWGRALTDGRIDRMERENGYQRARNELANSRKRLTARMELLAGKQIITREELAEESKLQSEYEALGDAISAIDSVLAETEGQDIEEKERARK